jgi:hypothetical protein
MERHGSRRQRSYRFASDNLHRLQGDAVNAGKPAMSEFTPINELLLIVPAAAK